MTFHLLPRTRRQFLQVAAAGGMATLASRTSAAPPESTVRWALLADTHIAGKKQAKGLGGTVMFDNLSRVIDEILAEDPLPAGAIINGDCAYLLGLEQDYQTLRQLIGRLVDGGVPVHLTMGNHDNRGTFFQAFVDQRSPTSLVEGKHVAVIDAGPVNLFLVDSLHRVNHTPGEIGAVQLGWLDRALAARDDKPALVFGHHHPQAGGKISGLTDTGAFLDLLHSHPQVQAYCFGHTHHWHLRKSAQQLNLVNQPPVAYVFEKTRPNGWLRMTVSDKATTLELRALDTDHPQHAERHELVHRLAVK